MFSCLVSNEQTAPWYISVPEILTYLPRKKEWVCTPCFMSLLKILGSTLNALWSPMLKNCLTLSCSVSPFEKHILLALRMKFGKPCHRGMYYLYAEKHSFFSSLQGKELNHWCEKKIKLYRKHGLTIDKYQENLLWLIGEIIWVSYLILRLSGRYYERAKCYLF